MKKILYLMEIDWYWIKQRPQIIAEMLAEDYDITVVYHKEVFVKQSLRKDKDELPNSIPIPAIPLRDKNILAYGVQKFYFHRIMKKINEFDMVWITHPLLYRYIPKSYQGKTVYDCMDNHEALCNDEKIKKTIRKSERALISRADMIFASSSGLMKKVAQLGGSRKVKLIRNGFVPQEIHPPVTVKTTENPDKRYKIGYFGTIAEWMDFTLLINSLKCYNNLEYHLWGPVSNIQVPNHSRLIIEGVVEHHQLWDHVKDMDCLIMPFLINDIVKDVDPVKLYEYISMGKLVLSIQYEEVERFRPYVFLYKTENEFLEILNRLIENRTMRKYTNGEQMDFLMDNTWDVRYKIIDTCIRKMLSNSI